MGIINAIIAALEASIAADKAAREAEAIAPVTAFADEVIAALEASIAADEAARLLAEGA